MAAQPAFRRTPGHALRAGAGSLRDRTPSARFGSCAPGSSPPRCRPLHPPGHARPARPRANRPRSKSMMPALLTDSKWKAFAMNELTDLPNLKHLLSRYEAIGGIVEHVALLRGNQK